MMNLLHAAAVLAMLAMPAMAQSTGTNSPSAHNSGAGIAGQPGNKNGPAAKPGQDQTATSQANSATSLQDPSKIPGKPGGKSGPAVMPPSKSANKP
jgi:hypothetical protein